MIAPGAVLVGKYRIERQLGAGGMGEVFVATQAPLNRKVAVKVLKAGGAERGEQAELRFFREMQALARLSHPNVVTVFDSGRAEDGSLYLAMELVEGPTLRDELVARGRLPAAQVIALGVQVARGLAAAHAQKIAHHDLKPENIVLQTTTSGPVVKLLDFGIARILEADAGPSGVTEEDSAIGTVGYMSPEQLRGVRDEPKSDLYALGCVLYEMITGDGPFSAKTGPELAVKHLTERPPPLRERTPQADVPPGLEVLVRALLEKDPALRPASADAVVDALARITSSTTAATEGATHTVFAPPSRRRLPRAALAAVVVVLVAGTAVVAAQMRTRGPCRIAVVQITVSPPELADAAALAEEIALSLGADPTLRVVSPFVVEQTQQRFENDPVAWARALELDLAVRGKLSSKDGTAELTLKVMQPPDYDDVGGSVVRAPTADALLDQLPRTRAALLGLPPPRSATPALNEGGAGTTVASTVAVAGSADGEIRQEVRAKSSRVPLGGEVVAAEEPTDLERTGKAAAAPEPQSAIPLAPKAEAPSANAPRRQRPPASIPESAAKDAGDARGAGDGDTWREAAVSRLAGRAALRQARQAFSTGNLAQAGEATARAEGLPAAALWSAMVETANGARPRPVSAAALLGRERRLAEALSGFDPAAAATLRAALPDDEIAAWLCAVIETRAGNREQAARDEKRARGANPALPPVR